jgi:hypothetical protein
VEEEEGEEEAVTCAICLDAAESPATLSGCASHRSATPHTFCLACIQQWSQVTNRCPLCKSPFDAIVHRGEVIAVEARSPRAGGGGDDEAAAEAAALAEALAGEGGCTSWNPVTVNLLAKFFGKRSTKM